MLNEGNIQHVEIVFRPATHNVETPTACTDLVQSRPNTGYQARMKEGGVHGRDQLQLLGRHG